MYVINKTTSEAYY